MLRHLSFLLLLILYTPYVCAYSDYDVDGVEDYYDKCPNTPFDVLVDVDGCAEGSSYKGVFNVATGMVSTKDSGTDAFIKAQVFVQYAYDAWDVSLSTFSPLQNTLEDVPNNYYITTGYKTIFLDTIHTKFSLGSKQSSVQDDYYFTVTMDTKVTTNQNLFLFYSYTIAQDTVEEQYDNFTTVSVGTGSSIQSYWYSALAYDYSAASASNAEDYHALSWSNTFTLNSKYYVLTQYSYGLSEGASDHTLSLQIGMKFE